MPLSMYQASVPLFIRQLQNLSAVLTIGETHAEAKKIDPLVLTSARLAPDMLPLNRQIHLATDSIKGMAARLSGTQNPSYPDTETTFPELQTRIAKTIAFLENIKAEQVDGSEDREIILKTGGTERKFTGRDYLLNFVIPNAFFHLTATYAILRHNGAGLGKLDYLGAL